ncbi:glycosyl transferase family 1 [Thiohalorhabdus denitrificans]|uniref:Glycosyltransferase involved in cell wall bisynthesis n=1 Tax=Thiohalorhabdus denitrificans TaxID=381306 RepID=A0A0P9CJS9_9GAMM|nr:glycosyltransferase [Thiohalorhabdus denitrificans]KPV39146.1 glycosyl transferase family 1 [Thiohalorhabdus denitrificans]SCX76413.1 Glycosyltransferase involved in cell wall bisynthesis [Thiohalorhabdus denitrificans]
MNLPKRIALFLSFSGDGGVERMMLNLAGAIARLGHPVDLVRAKAEGGHDQAPEGVRVIDLGTAHTRTSLKPLTRYLRRERPDAMLAAKDRANRVAIRARQRAGVDTRLAVRLGTHLSRSLEGRSGLKKWLRYRPMRAAYPHADAIVAVSAGVAEDTARITGIPQQAIHVIPNPVVTPGMREAARQPVGHPWLEGDSREIPVVVAAGRLTRQKDFPTLLRAFARLREERPARLIILGEGRDRPELEALAAELGIAGDLDLPGFAANPYAFMAGADLFALSSAWEGSPNVLTEALALGTPVAATDCQSGPRETLAGGRYGPLVPVGDAEALGRALADTLAEPPESAFLQEAAAPFEAEASARAYLAALGVRSDTP